MLESGQVEYGRNRRSCTYYGCAAVLAVSVIFAGWISSGFIVWKQCRIPLPDGSGSVVYMARLNKIICAEWNRKVRVETNSMHSPSKWIPSDTAGGSPVNVYWYPAHGTKGPYLRFQDPLSEYLVDIRHSKVFLVVRQGRDAYVGEVLTRNPSNDISISGPTWANGKVIDSTVEVAVEVDGHPARLRASSSVILV